MPLEQQPATIAAATEFANAMAAAGTPITPEQVLQQGLTIIELTGKDGKKYQIALTQNGYPLMVRAEGGDWSEFRPRLIEGLNGAKVYIAGDYKNIVEMDKIHGPVFSGLSTEWAFHLDVLRQKSGDIDFGITDYALKMGKQAGMDSSTNGMLIWDNGNMPEWIKQYNSKEKLLPLITEHIKTVTEKYKGRLDTWIVVNEPYKPGDMDSSFWYNVFGADSTWIQQAFASARANDPDAKLILNDFQIEFEGNSKYEQILNLCKDLKDKGIPIDGIGFQMHIYGNDLITGVQTYEGLRKSIKAFQSLGLEVQFTELDVDMSGYNGSTADKLRQQAEIYYQLGKIASKEGIISITMFGEKDDTSWIVKQFPDKVETALPTLFDKDYHKKLAYYAYLKGVVDGLH